MFHSRSLKEAIMTMPEYAKVQGDICIKRKKSNAVIVTSYSAHTVSNKRRQIEDYCRDLVITLRFR